jgi:hypothetical protein
MRSSAPTKPRLNWWPIAVIVLSACAFCWPVFAGRLMLPADMCLLMLPWKALQSQFPGFHRAYNPMLDPIQQYLPWRIYAVESLREGFIPLWNPYAFCGTPFLANLQSTVLYPLNLLFLITGARYGFGVSAILHLILGGLFMYAFLRTLALLPAAALLGALVLMFNGWTVTWLEYPTLSLWVFMWLPALLLCYERALREPRSLWPALCALVVGIQFLGGHLQISAYVLIAFVLYAVVRLIARDERRVGRVASIGIAVIALVIGFALAGAQLLPTIELATQSGRISQGAGAALKTAFPLSHFILYLVPNFFGNPVDYNYWGNVRDLAAFNFFETACYVGILPLLLAVLSFAGSRSWRHWFFALLTLFAILAAIGSPLYLVLYYLAPGFRELAGLGRVLCLAAFGLAGLAAIGLDALLEDSAAGRTRLHVVSALVACLCVAVGRLAFQPYVELLDKTMHVDDYLKHQVAIAFAFIVLSALLIGLRVRRRLGVTATGLIACGLILADLFVSGMSLNPFTDPQMAYPETDAIHWLQDHAGHDRVTSLASEGFRDWMPHNSPMVFGLRDIHGSDSLRVKRSFELVSGPELAQATYPPPDSPVMAALGVRYLITRRTVGDRWQLVSDSDVPIYEDRDALPRAFVVSDFTMGADEDFADLLAGGAAELRRKALLAPGPTPLQLPSKGAPPPETPATFDRDAPDEVVIETNAETPGLLVLLDSYYPGWRARVYEAPVAVHRANYGFRGVEIPAGRQVVTFSYEPATFRIGLFVSLIACAALAAAAICGYLRKSDNALRRARRS